MSADALFDNPGIDLERGIPPVRGGLRIAEADRGAELTVTLDHEARLVRAVGEGDLSTAGLLSHFLEQEASSGESVTLDLSGVSFMDSSGIAALLRGLASTDRSAELILLHPSRHVRRVLQASGLDCRPGLRILE